MIRCRPHRWNVEDWLPLWREVGATPDDHDSIRCVNCGRVLRVEETSANQRSSIAGAIASRLFCGDEYSEVYDAVMEFFRGALHRQIPMPRMDFSELMQGGAEGPSSHAGDEQVSILHDAHTGG